jgi:PEP-CTERM motif-containing protein
MNPTLSPWRDLPRFARFGLLSVLFFFNSFMSASATELLVRWSEGGPDRYTGVWGTIAIGFSVEEATRIESVRTWISHDGPVTASLLLADLSHTLYSETFVSQATLRAPAKWQGVSSLRWDLEPGEYYLSFGDGFFPLGLPVIHPNPPGVQSPFDFELLYPEGWEHTGFPFGVEIYGEQLSAIPEPATYGLVASAALLGLAAFRRRRVAAKT